MNERRELDELGRKARVKHEEVLINKIQALCKDSYSDYGKLLRIRKLIQSEFKYTGFEVVEK